MMTLFCLDQVITFVEHSQAWRCVAGIRSLRSLNPHSFFPPLPEQVVSFGEAQLSSASRRTIVFLVARLNLTALSRRLVAPVSRGKLTNTCPGERKDE